MILGKKALVGQKQNQSTSRILKTTTESVMPGIHIRTEKTYGGGNFKKIVAFDRECNRLGYIAYTIYKWGIYMDFIEVEEPYQRKGVGTTLIDWMASKYGYNNLKWGLVVKNGLPFRIAMDRRHQSQDDDLVFTKEMD